MRLVREGSCSEELVRHNNSIHGEEQTYVPAAKSWSLMNR